MGIISGNIKAREEWLKPGTLGFHIKTICLFKLVCEIISTHILLVGWNSIIALVRISYLLDSFRDELLDMPDRGTAPIG